MTPLHNIALALAATGLSAKQLESALKELQRDGYFSLLQIVTEMQKADRTNSREDQVRVKPPSRSQPRESEAVILIEKMLREEAGLSAADAVRLLTEEATLRYRKDTPALPPYSRNSLRDWLERLLRVLPSSEVLHLASRIRNERSHGVGASTWKLNPERSQ